MPPFRLQREAPSQREENNKREKSIRLKAEKRPRLHSAASRSGLKLKLRHGSFVWSCRVKEKTSQSGACEVAAKARRSISAGSPGRQIVTVNSVWPSQLSWKGIRRTSRTGPVHQIFALIRFGLNFPCHPCTNEFKFFALCHAALSRIRLSLEWTRRDASTVTHIQAALAWLKVETNQKVGTWQHWETWHVASTITTALPR